MQESTRARGWERAVSFISDDTFSLVDANNRDANRIAATTLELRHLIPEIVNDPIYLLDHRLGQELDFHPDFHCCDWASSNLVFGINDRGLTWYEFSERRVPASGHNTSALILCVQNTVFSLDCGFDQLWRTVDTD